MRQRSGDPDKRGSSPSPLSMFVNAIRLSTQIIALDLEVRSNNQMRLTSKTPRSVLSMVKKEYGFRGNKVSVLAQLRQLKEVVDKALSEGKTEI